MASSVLAHAIELETLLSSHGADVFGYERLGDRAVVTFEWSGIRLRLMVQLPNIADYATTAAYGRPRAARVIQQDYNAEVRRRWSAMRYLISAKIDAIAVGVTTFEAEFDQFRAPVAAIAAEAGASR